MKKTIILSLLIVLSIVAFGQNERKFVRNGNKLFMQAVSDTTKVDSIKFSNAETEYRKALEKRPEDLKWDYNLADALYKQQRFEEAEEKFTALSEKMVEPEERARANHNLGNTQLMQEKLDESIESYKKALRENPTDIETKYNLAYAQMLKKKKEEQEKKDQENKDKNKDQDKDKDKDKDKNKDQDKDKDQNKDQQNKDNQDKNKDQNKDQQNKDQNKNKDQQNKDQQQKQQPQQNKISKQDAEQLLQALQNDERDIQDKVKKAKAAKAKRSKSEKEW